MDSDGTLEPKLDLHRDWEKAIVNLAAKDPVAALKLMNDVLGIYSKYRGGNYDFNVSVGMPSLTPPTSPRNPHPPPRALGKDS